MVLEAWGGLTARAALRLISPAALGAGHRTPHDLDRPTGSLNKVSKLEVIGLIATLLATTAWVAPLASALGPESTARAWKIALPVSIGLQWLLRRRYLTGAGGIGRLRQDRGVLAIGAAGVLVVLAALALNPDVALPGALVVTWVGGLVVVVRGWGVAYGAALVIAMAGLLLGIDVVVDIALVVVLTAVAVTAALLTSPLRKERPTPWRRSLPSALIGALLGTLIIIDPSVEWSSTRPFPVIALVPALLGTLWAGHHLDRIWTILLSALASTQLRDRTSRRNWRVFASIVLGAVGRLVLGTGVASAVTFLVLRGDATNETQLLRLLLGLGAFGLVGFLASLLEGFSRLGGALLTVGAALTSAALVVNGPAFLAGQALLVAAVVALLAALVPVVRLVRQPDRTLATLF